MDENTAAVKIQALQRGGQGRKQVEAIKQGQQQTGDEAPPLHRQLFRRPHARLCAEFAVMKMDLAAARGNGGRSEALTWEGLVAAVEAELLDAAGIAISLVRSSSGDASAGADGTPSSRISYSTTRNPTVFGNFLTEKVYRHLIEYDIAKAHAEKLREEHEAIEAAKPPPPKVEIKYDENGDEIPPPPKPKKVLREEAERKRLDQTRLTALLEAEHAVQCLALKVQNVLALHSIRVSLGQ